MAKKGFPENLENFSIADWRDYLSHTQPKYLLAKILEGVSPSEETSYLYGHFSFSSRLRKIKTKFYKPFDYDDVIFHPNSGAMFLVLKGARYKFKDLWEETPTQSNFLQLNFLDFEGVRFYYRFSHFANLAKFNRSKGIVKVGDHQYPLKDLEVYKYRR